MKVVIEKSKRIRKKPESMRNEIFIGYGLREEEQIVIARAVLKSGIPVKLWSRYKLYSTVAQILQVVESPL